MSFRSSDNALVIFYRVYSKVLFWLTILVVATVLFAVLGSKKAITKPCEIPPDGVAVVPYSEFLKHDYCECESNGKWFRARERPLLRCGCATMKHRDEKGDDRFAEDMTARAEMLEPAIPDEVFPSNKREMGSPGTTIMQHVSRLCTEWAEADPIKTEKRQSVYGTWAQIWNQNARGMFTINLNTGTVWQTKTRPPSKPIGNVRELTGRELVDLLQGD